MFQLTQKHFNIGVTTDGVSHDFGVKAGFSLNSGSWLAPEVLFGSHLINEFFEIGI